MLLRLKLPEQLVKSFPDRFYALFLVNGHLLERPYIKSVITLGYWSKNKENTQLLSKG